MQVIQDQPGINKMALCHETGLAWGTVFRHIKLLEERGDLEVRRDGREAQLFPTAVPVQQRRLLAALREEDASAVYDEVQRRGEARIQELAGELGMSRKVVRRYLRTLCNVGLLRRTAHYHPRYKAVDPDDRDVS